MTTTTKTAKPIVKSYMDAVIEREDCRPVVLAKEVVRLVKSKVGSAVAKTVKLLLAETTRSAPGWRHGSTVQVQVGSRILKVFLHVPSLGDDVFSVLGCVETDSGERITGSYTVPRGSLSQVLTWVVSEASL